MAFGLSFGSKTNTTQSNTSANKVEDSTQSGTTNQSQQQNTSSTGATNQTGQTSNQGATKTAGTTAQQTTGTQQTTQTTNSFSDAILAALEASTKNALGAANQQVDTSSLAGFNKDQFVAGGMASATAASNAGLEKDINGLVDNVGGTTSGNSMAALLANRLRGDASANLAGVNAQLTGQAEQINRENVLAGITGQQANQGWAANLLAGLKGGTSTTTGTAATSEATRGNTQNIGSEQNSGTSANQQQTMQDQQTNLTSIIAQLVNNLTKTSANETSNSTTKSKGGGLSLGI